MMPSPLGFTEVCKPPDVQRYICRPNSQYNIVLGGILFAGGLAPPLYIHRAEERGANQLSTATAEREWELRVAAAFRIQA